MTVCHECGARGAAWSDAEAKDLCARCIGATNGAGPPETDSENDGAGGPRGLLVDMSDALARADEPIEYPAWPIAARGFVTVLVGQHSSYKSWLLLGVAHAVHVGRKTIAGLRCHRGVALYVDAENGPKLMARRFRAAGIPADGMLVADGLRLRLPADVSVLRALVAATGATLVVLDSLRRLAPGVRENESDDLAPLFAGLAAIARDLDVAIVLIHHRSTKPGAPISRGSSAIEDQTDLMFSLSRERGDPDRERRRLAPEKFRIDEEPAPLWLRVGTAAGHLTVDAAEPHGEGRPAGTRDKLASAAVDLVKRAAEPLARPEIAQALNRKSNDGTLRRALEHAVDDGQLTLTDDRYAPPGKGAISA